MVLFAPAMLALFAQRPSPAEGPWSGQAQCVVTAKGTDYLDEQTHTWRLTGEPPTPAARGSAQVYYTWPATWSVQGSGRKTFPPREPVAPGREPSERWTIASEMKMTLRITDVGSGTGRLRIGRGVTTRRTPGAMRVTEVSGRTIDAAVQPWSFPAVEDSVSKTTISGTSTRTYPEDSASGGVSRRRSSPPPRARGASRQGVDPTAREHADRRTRTTGGRARDVCRSGAPAGSAAAPPPGSAFAGAEGEGTRVGLTGQTVVDGGAQSAASTGANGHATSRKSLFRMGSSRRTGFALQVFWNGTRLARRLRISAALLHAHAAHNRQLHLRSSLTAMLANRGAPHRPRSRGEPARRNP